MADVKRAAEQTEAAVVIPENPLGEGAGHVMLTAPYDTAGLAAELAAAMPKAATVLRGPSRLDEPVSEANPAWLAFTGADASEATVRRVVGAHDPASSGEATRKIRGSGVANGLQDLKERLSAGEVLDAIETSKAIALLLGIYPPGPSRAAQATPK